MNSSLFKHLSLGALTIQLCTGVALAQEVPSMVGTWDGQNYGINVDGSQVNPSSSWKKPELSSRTIRLEITKQKDRRFWGEIFANGKSEGPFIGVLSMDGKIVSMVCPNAIATGIFTGIGKIEYCTSDASISTGNQLFSASCSQLTKTK